MHAYVIALLQACSDTPQTFAGMSMPMGARMDTGMHGEHEERGGTVASGRVTQPSLQY